VRRQEDDSGHARDQGDGHDSLAGHELHEHQHAGDDRRAVDRSGVGDAAINGTVSSLDLSAGLSDPATVAAAAAAPQPALSNQALRASSGVNAATTPPAGCIRRTAGPNSSPTLVSAGVQGCTATDHIEVDYDNGDKVNVFWSETATSFDLRVTVIAGPWTGTDLHYAGNVTASGATVTVDGVMKYSKLGSAVHVDATFALTYTITGSATPSSATATIQVSGTATDKIALVSAHQGWTLSLHTSTNGTTDTATLDWNGTIGVDTLKPDLTKDHSVAFNVNAHIVTQTTGTSSTATWSVGGDVEYDGAVCGTIVSKNNQLFVDWTDGTEDAFDGAAMFGGAGV